MKSSGECDTGGGGGGGINLRQKHRYIGCLAETRYRFLYLFVRGGTDRFVSSLCPIIHGIMSIEMYIDRWYLFKKRKSMLSVHVRYLLATGRRLN